MSFPLYLITEWSRSQLSHCIESFHCLSVWVSESLGCSRFSFWLHCVFSPQDPCCVRLDFNKKPWNASTSLPLSVALTISSLDSSGSMSDGKSEETGSFKFTRSLGRTTEATWSFTPSGIHEYHALFSINGFPIGGMSCSVCELQWLESETCRMVNRNFDSDMRNRWTSEWRSDHRCSWCGRG